MDLRPRRFHSLPCLKLWGTPKYQLPLSNRR